MSEFKPGQVYRRQYSDERLEQVRAVVDDGIVVIRFWNARTQTWDYAVRKPERLKQDIAEGWLTLVEDAPA